MQKHARWLVALSTVTLAVGGLTACNPTEDPADAGSSTSSSSSGGSSGTPAVRYYGGSDPKGDYLEIQVDDDGHRVRRINHTNSEDSGWLDYAQETAMANGFSVLNRANLPGGQFVLFGEFPDAAIVYQVFDSTQTAVGNPVYVVSRQATDKSAYYSRAYNWMKFTIDDGAETDMEAGFAAFDTAANTTLDGLMYGAGYSHRRERMNPADANGGVSRINDTSSVGVSTFVADTATSTNYFYSGGVNDWAHRVTLSGTASGTNILDFGLGAGGGSGVAIPQATTGAFQAAYAGTYFFLVYEYEARGGARQVNPMKFVLSSSGVKVHAWDDDAVVFDQPLVPLASLAGGPVDNEDIKDSFARVAGNAAAVSPSVQQAHLCPGAFIANQVDGTVATMLFDPAGQFATFTMFENLEAEGPNPESYVVRFGFGIKDTGYVQP